MVSSTIDRRNADEQADDVDVEVLHTGKSGHSGGLVDIADPRTVDVDVSGGAAKVACVPCPGAIDIGDNVG